MSVGENIKRLRREKHYTQRDLANLIGVVPTTVSAWESGRAKPLMDKVTLIADVFGVPMSEVAGRADADVDAEPALPIHSYPYIPAAISAGTPETVDAIAPDQLEQVAIPDAVMGKWAGHSDISLMRANGDSMNRVIPNGSLIGVHKIDEISDLKNGDIVVFDCDGEYAVKRFFNDKQNRTYIFQPDSDRDGFFPVTQSYDDEDLVAIVGKVVMYVVELS